MRYNIKFLLCSTTLALTLGLLPIQNAEALISAPQADNVPGRVSLAPELENDMAPSQNVDPLLPNRELESSAPQKNASVDDFMKPSPRSLGQQNPQPAANNNSQVNGVAPASASVGQNNNPILKSSASAKKTDPLADIVPLSEEEKALYGDNILNQLGGNLFSQMSDIEKQSALLSLELRREKIRAEIEAIRNQRKKALAEEEALKEEKLQKQREWEAEQEKKKFEMEQEKRKLELEAEKLRQETLVKAYKEKMLEREQAWIETMAKAYKEVSELNKDREFLLSDFTRKLDNLRSMAAQAVTEANNAKVRYDKDVSVLKTQISVLKARLAAEQAAKKATNPFAQISNEVKPVMLSDVYAVMEIVGKDDNLVAKLINKNGDSFLVKKGTILQTGHVVDDISETFVSADLDGVKDYLFFSAGGILDAEPASNGVMGSAKEALGDDASKKGSKPAANLFSSEVPNLGQGMFVK